MCIRDRAWDSLSRWNGRVVIDSNDYPAKNLDCMFVRDVYKRQRVCSKISNMIMAIFIIRTTAIK